MGEIKETFEEAANKYAESYRCPATNDNEYCRHDIISAINFGAQWQAERMYSEEDMIKFAKWSNRKEDKSKADLLKIWLENLKNKLHKCKYCGVETTQPDDECYAKPAKKLTAVEWFLRHVNIGGVKQGHGLNIDEVKKQALEMEKQQILKAYDKGYDCYPYEPEQYYSETYKKDEI